MINSLSLNASSSSNWYNHQGVQAALSNGEYLSYARYIKYIPGTPQILHNPMTSWVGDSCRVVNAAIRIKDGIDRFGTSNSDEKIKIITNVAQQILIMTNTQYGERATALLPKNACLAISATYSTTVASIALAEQGKASRKCLEEDELSSKIEGIRQGASTINSALSLAGYSRLSPARLSLSLGYGALTATKAVVYTAEFFRKTFAKLY
jgi:hypothetical protein